MQFRRGLVCLLCLAVFAAAGMIFTARAQQGGAAATPHPAAPQAPASQPTRTAGQQFKNVQVLKDVPADQLISAMQFITASLGVDCEYCHVERAFDKDDKKPKLAARKMMEMVANINKENFDGHREVTCNSCHRGAAHPMAIPAITSDTKPMMMAGGEAIPASEPPNAEDLLDKYLAAEGGTSALKKIMSRVQKGTITAFGDQQFPIEIYSQAPDKRFSVTHFKQGDSITAYNGKDGWLQTQARVHVMNAQEKAEAHIDADIAFAANVRTMYAKFTTRPGEQIDGHDTWMVVGRTEGQPPLRLYLDQKTGLLVRMVRYTDSPLGYNPTQIDYSDYRDADGVKVPYQWTLARPGNHFTIKVTELQQNVPVDDAKFVPPPPQPAH